MKVLALLSGGLDSMLAIKLVQEQGIEVIGISFVTPFFTSLNAEKAAKVLKIPLKVVDITDEHLKILKAPKYGYGKRMNPCIDCHALMIKKAGELMEELGASYIITGEVLGERPKSQNKQALGIVEKESGYKGYILRSLSAKLLDITIPEEKGWVVREKLGSIKGRSRKPQLELAKKYGLKDFPTPAGGCLLTDIGFSKRLKKLFEKKEELLRSDLELLKYGRHYYSSEGKRIVVSRNKLENEALMNLTEDGDFIFKIKSYPGPLAIVRGKDIGEDTIYEAALLTARYGKAREVLSVSVSYFEVGKEDITDEIVVSTPLKTLEEKELTVV